MASDILGPNSDGLQLETPPVIEPRPEPRHRAVSERRGERFRTIVVFSTERWAAWASPAFPLFTTGARKAPWDR